MGFGALTVQTSVDIAMPLSSLAMVVHWSLRFCGFEFKSTSIFEGSFDLLACEQLVIVLFSILSCSLAIVMAICDSLTK